MANGLQRAEALEILKLALDDIERMKRQQWREFYGTLAIQGGLLVMFTDHDHARWLFLMLAWLAAFFGAMLISSNC